MTTQHQKLASKAKDILKIDLAKLDEECERQPGLYFEFSSALSEAKSDLDRAKAKLDLIDAELDRCIRRSPELFGLDKLTEPAIKATIPRQSEHENAFETMLSAKRDVAVLQAAVDALDHKKSMIGHSVSLFIAGYFSKPGKNKQIDDVGARKFTKSQFTQKPDK